MSTEHRPALGQWNRGIIYDIGIGNTLVGNYEYWRNSFIKFTILYKLDIFLFSGVEKVKLKLI